MSTGKVNTADNTKAANPPGQQQPLTPPKDTEIAVAIQGQTAAYAKKQLCCLPEEMRLSLAKKERRLVQKFWTEVFDKLEYGHT